MKSNNKTLLVAALACNIAAALTYFAKWISLYMMKASVWSIAEIVGELGKYMGDSGYQLFSALIYGGAILAIALLAFDSFRIASPLISGMQDASYARRSGIGAIATVVYVAAFCILVLHSGEGELDGASLTLWPFVNGALAILGRVLVNRVDDADGDSASQPFSRANRAARAGAGAASAAYEANSETANTIDIPVTNYAQNSAFQPSMLRYSKATQKASLLIAAYHNHEAVRALQVRIILQSVFGDCYYVSPIAFTNLKTIVRDGMTFLVTEPVEIDILNYHAHEITSARVVIDRIARSSGASASQWRA